MDAQIVDVTPGALIAQASVLIADQANCSRGHALWLIKDYAEATCHTVEAVADAVIRRDIRFS